MNVLSGAPYGYRYVRKSEMSEAQCEIVEPGASVVREVFRLYVEEMVSIGEIARILTHRGIPTATGKVVWDRSTIWGFLRNPAYAGRASFGKTGRVDVRPALTRRVRLAGPRFTAPEEDRLPATTARRSSQLSLPPRKPEAANGCGPTGRLRAR